MRRPAPLLFAALAFALPFVAAVSPASAGSLADCGNIDVSASAQCELQTSGGCQINCTPVHFAAQCDAECTGSASASCTGSCEGTCEGSCSGGFDCKGYCTADCDGKCDGECSATSDQANCKASCQASCGVKCEGSCKVNPPDCKGKCQASCSGSCQAQANVSCTADCSAKLSGGCSAQCSQPKGALFCNGQYVDAGDHLQNCLDYLGSIGIKVSASGDASCSGNSCKAEGQASATCAMTPGSVPFDGAALALLGAAAGLVVARRRRRG
jgi:hypothetical protein